MRKSYLGVAAAAALIVSAVAYSTPADAQRMGRAGVHVGGAGFAGARMAGPRFGGARFAAGPRFHGARFVRGARFGGPIVARGGARFAYGGRYWWRGHHHRRAFWPFAAAAFALPFLASGAYAYDYGYPYGYPSYAAYGGCCPCY